MNLLKPTCGVLTGFLLLFGLTESQAQSNVWWTGANNALWNNALNWQSTNGAPGTIPGGSGGTATKVLHFGTNGLAVPLTTNDINNLSSFFIFFDTNTASAGTNFVLYLKSGTGAPTLNDFNQNPPGIQNNSINLQTVDMSFNLQARGISTAANRAANLNPTVGDLLFTTNCVITLIQDTQLRFFSSAGHVVSIYGPILQTVFSNGCVLATAGSVGAGATVNFFNTNTCTNLVINCGLARFATNVMNAPITLGDANVNNAPATLLLDNGFFNLSRISTQAGSTNFRTIGNSAFGSGTADFMGTILLGTNLVTSANPAGTLEFDGNVDFQNPGGTGPRSLTVSGAGNTIFTGSFTNASTGSSVLVKTNSGSVAILGTNNGARILFNHGGGTISITNGNAIGIPTGVNYPDKFNFTANATLAVTNSFTLGRNVSGADNAGFRIAGGATGTFDVAAASTLTIDGPVIDIPGTGSGSLTKTDFGSLVLQQSNSYSGTTTISAGTLVLAGSGSLSHSSNIVLNAGATLDVSSLSSAPSLVTGQTLTASSGTGNLTGALNLSAGALVLNYTNGTPSLQVSDGQLNFNNNSVTVTVAGTPLPAGSYKLVSAGAGGSVGGSVALASLVVNGAGFSPGAQTSLSIVGNELYLVVNHGPTATPMNLTRTAGSPIVKILLGDLAANWTDADNDAISLVSVGVSTNGVVLATNGVFLVYSNASNVADEIGYIIADAQGATTNGIVRIATAQEFSGQMQTLGVISGFPTLKFAGIPGYSYSVQRSTNLPVWVTIWTTNAPGGGLFEFTDEFPDFGGTAPPSAFYRLSSQ